MYIVSLFCRNKKYEAQFATEKEACSYANMFWHLSPRVTAPDGKPIVEPTEDSCESEF